MPSPARLRSLCFASVVALAAAGACGPLPGPVERAPSSASANASGSTVAALPVREATPGLRLPADVRPLGYSLELDIDPSKPRFSGRAELALSLATPRRSVFAHGKGLEVRRASFRAGGQTWPAVVERDSPQVLRFTSEERPVEGSVTLVVEYDAPFAPLEGLYRVQSGGEWYAFTQLEALYAREMFPCIDEPEHKVPFDVSLVVPAGQRALANTAESARAAIDGGKERVTFARTKPLPTYLLAVAVGPLDVVDGPPVPANEVRAQPLALRGVATKGRGKELAYALRHTGKLVASLERYTGVAYPYDKLDVVAVPQKRGAMENPGLVTFGEWLLLLDEKTAPAQQVKAFTSVMAHELAHQWFGNLVTMKWWDDLWLNEAFATWVTYRTVMDVKPELRADEDQVSGYEDAFHADSLLSARAVREPIRTEDDIVNAFDGITYRKGGSILAMLESWLGHAIFQDGIKKYLSSHAHGVATLTDFLSALETASGQEVSRVARSLLDKPGLPLVEVRRTCPAAKGGPPPSVRLDVSRWLPHGANSSEKPVFEVPVCLRWPGADGATKQRCEVVGPAGADVRLDGEKCPAWLHPNAGATGYYRFSLDADDVGPLLRAKELSVRERASIAASVRADVRRGALPLSEALPLVAPLAKETTVLLAMEPVQLLGLGFRVSDDLATRDGLREAMRALLPAQKGPSTWLPGGTEVERALRTDRLTSWVHTAREPRLRKEALAEGLAALAALEAGTAPRVAPDLLGLVLEAVGELGSRADWERLTKVLSRPLGEAERQAVVRGIASAETEPTAGLAREWALGPDARPNEAQQVLAIQLGTRSQREATLAFLEASWSRVEARLPPAMRSGLPWIASSLCSKPHADRARKLFAPVEALEGGKRNLASVLEAVETCASLAGHLRLDVAALAKRGAKALEPPRASKR